VKKTLNRQDAKAAKKGKNKNEVQIFFKTSAFRCSWRLCVLALDLGLGALDGLFR
jgi:hypothetical protein